VSVQLVSKIFNVCDPDPPTSQIDRQTDIQTDRQTDGRHAISIQRYALVHRAVKIVPIRRPCEFRAPLRINSCRRHWYYSTPLRRNLRTGRSYAYI